MTPCSPIEELLQTAIEDGTFPGAAYAIGNREVIYLGTVGHTRYTPQSPPVTPHTYYDLASLTKVVATTTYAMTLFPNPENLIYRSVESFLPEFKNPEVTIGHLLRHDSGMPAYDWTLAGTTLDAQEAKTRLLAIRPEKPPGTETVYSCLNFVLLKECLERGEGVDFEALAHSRTGTYRPTKHLPDSTVYAPTETIEPWRPGLPQFKDLPSQDNEFVQGIVHDPVAYYQGGVSGNAGLFGTILQLEAYAQKWVTDPESYSPYWQKWTTRQSETSTRALGWDTKLPEGSSCGSSFGPRSFGHLGFTGTSLWIDPDAGAYAVLLTNRVHPTADNLKIQQFRPVFHDLVHKLLNVRKQLTNVE